MYLKILVGESLCNVKKEIWDGQGTGSPRCTHTHVLHSHLSAHSACTVTSAHLHACAHTRMAKVSEKVCCMCISLMSVSPSMSHVSPIFAVSVRRISIAFPVHTVLAELTCPESAGHAHHHTSAVESGYMSVFNTQGRSQGGLARVPNLRVQ